MSHAVLCQLSSFYCWDGHRLLMTAAAQTQCSLPLPLRSKSLGLESQMSATMEQNRRILAALAVEIASVLLYISVAGINITIKATGKVPKGIQDKNSRRELTPRPQSSTTYWLVSGLTSQLVFSCSPEPPTDGWYSPHWATRIST